MSGRKLRIKVKKLPHCQDLPLPSRASSGSSGFDLLACVGVDVLLEPGEASLIPTGISIEIPRGYEAQVRPRSGLALKNGISVLNSPGTVDSDYRGEIGVLLINHAKSAFRVKRGDRIAQLVFCRVCEAHLEESGDLLGTDRGEGGFGHTGI